MKKNYKKPAYLAESFAFTQAIAQCGGSHQQGVANYGSPETCAWLIDSLPENAVFLENVSKCEVGTTVGDVNDFGGICYHTPCGEVQAFGSY